MSPVMFSLSLLLQGVGERETLGTGLVCMFSVWRSFRLLFRCCAWSTVTVGYS